MKLLYLDCETTGLDAKKNGLIQVAGIIEINGKVVEEFDIKCRPFIEDVVDAQALLANKTTPEELATRQAPGDAFRIFRKILDKFIDRYEKDDKFHMVGQNAKFDYDFMTAWFLKNGDRFFYAYINYHLLDLVSATALLKMAGLVTVPNMKLGTVCEHLGIKLDAHDALNDIRATREVYQRYISMVQENGLKIKKEASAA